MYPSEEADLASLPIVIRYGEEGYDDIPNEQRRDNIIEEVLRRARERIDAEDNVVSTNSE
jgi:hypothetical protein